MRAPFVDGAHGGRDAARGEDALLDVVRAHPRDRGADRIDVVRVVRRSPSTVEQRVAVPRIVRVGANPAVGGRPEPRQRGEAHAGGLPAAAEVALAANRRGDVFAVEGDGIDRAAALSVQLSGGDECDGDTRHRGFLHRELRREMSRSRR